MNQENLESAITSRSYSDDGLTEEIIDYVVNAKGGYGQEEIDEINEKEIHLSFGSEA